MFSIEKLPRILLDPRGRANRMEMLIAAVVMVAIEAALAIVGPGDGAVTWAIKAVAIWIGLAASAKRLHDLGYSAWWLAAGLGVLCMWSTMLAFAFLIFGGAEVLTEGSLGVVMFVGLTMMPAIGAALWLHLAEGEAQENRFGPAPEASRPSVAANQTQEA